MNDAKDLIADARKARVQESVFPIHTRMLDALETQRDRIAELEAELEEESGRANDEHLNYMRSDRGRSELAAVIEKVRAWLGTEDDWWDEDDGPVHAPVDLHKILNSVPADLLREHDADVWDAGFADGRRQDAEGDDGPRFMNPYRVKPEDEWVDPEPWFYPATGVRTAHKLAQTNAEYRPRKVKPEDER